MCTVHNTACCLLTDPSTLIHLGFFHHPSAFDLRLSGLESTYNTKFESSLDQISYLNVISNEPMFSNYTINSDGGK